MAQLRELDPSASIAAFFGAELRKHRLAAGMTQEQLGSLINYTGSLVGLVELAQRTPTLDFAESCDTALGTDGLLARLWPLLRRATFPAFVRQFVEMEATATRIRSFECQLMPGLLQTAEYARAVLQVQPHPTATALDEAVAARLSRQSLLTREDGPVCWFVLDEAVIRRVVGGADVMAGQLSWLMDLATRPNVFVQVVPFDAGEYPGLDGALTLLSFENAPDVGYVESHGGTAVLIDSPQRVAACTLAFDLMRATALSPKRSIEMIKAAMEGFDEPARPDGSGVA